MLFKIENWYNLKTLEEETRKTIKKKYPNPVEEEDMDTYNDFLEDEYKLELASRLKEMAAQLEKAVENKVKQNGYV